MQIIKLENRMTVLVEKGEVRLAELPTGVFYKPSAKAWGVRYPEVKGGWGSTSISINAYGLIRSFDMAVALREERVGVLVRRRLIVRYLAGYKGAVGVDGYYYVTNPLTKTRHKFDSRASAERYNTKVTDEWLDQYQIARSEIYKENRRVGDRNASTKGKAASCLLEKARAESQTHHVL